MKILTAVISKPLIWSLAGLLVATALEGSMSLMDREKIWRVGMSVKHQNWWNQTLARLKDGQVVLDQPQCGWSLQPSFEKYIQSGELTEEQASNYCPPLMIIDSGSQRS